MLLTFEQLAEAALNLPYEERSLLTERLHESLATADLKYEEEWIAEAERRAEELASGKVQGIPAEEVLAKLRRIVRE